MMFRILTLSLTVLLVAAAESSASMILSATTAGQAGTPAVGDNDNGNFTGGGSFMITPGMMGANDLVEFSVEAYAKPDGTRTPDGSFNIGFFTGAGAAKAYDFKVTFKNLVGSALGDPVQLSSVGDGVGPVDVAMLTTGGDVGTAFDTMAPAFGTSSATFANAGIKTSSFLRIGGANGGGYWIPNGEDGMLFFTITTPATTSFGSFALQFTANPEPGTMMLGGLAMSLMGGGYSLRRRRRKMAPEIVA